MNEKLKLLSEKLKQDEALKKELEQNPPKTSEDLIEAAKRLGIVLTDEDLSDFGKLSAEEIDQIAGGKILRG